jgi:hypothetical protein
MPLQTALLARQQENLAKGDARGFRYDQWGKDFWTCAYLYGGALSCISASF